MGKAQAAAPDNSLTFNGTSQYVRLGTVGASTDKLNAANFTIEVWFNRTGNGMTTTTSGAGGGGLSAAIPLVAKGRGEAEYSNVDFNYFFGIDDTTDRLAVDFEDSTAVSPNPNNHSFIGSTTITNNVWHHAAATYDGQAWRLYLDGRLDATQPLTASPRSDSIQRTAIGSAVTSTGAAGGFFQGAIDEVRIWNVARSFEQIRDAKDDEVTGGSGLVGRWGLDEGSGTTVADSTSNGITGTLTSSPVGTTPTWNLGQYAFPQDTTAPPAPLGLGAVASNGSVNLTWTTSATSDLVGYNVYRGTSPGVSTGGTPLNGDAPVSAGAYADAAVANGTTYYYAVAAVDTSNNKASTEVSATPSSALTALSLDGTNDYVTFGSAPGLATPTFTLETWFKRTGPGVGQGTGTNGLTSAVPLITKGRNEADAADNRDMNYFLGIDTATNRLAVDFEEGAGGASPSMNHPLIGNTAIANGVWHHAAATYDGNQWTLYLDGQVDGSLVVGQPARGDSIQHAALGTAMTSTGVAGGFFQGVLDEARIWNSARSQAQIQAAMDLELSSGAGLVGRWGLNDGAGTTATDSIGGTNGTLANGPAWVVGYPLNQPPPAGPHALAFDGSNDHVTFGPATSTLGASQFTLETWFRRTGAGVGTSTGNGGIASAIPLVTKGRAEAEGSNVDMNYFLGIDASTGVLVGDFEDTATGANHPISGVSAIPADSTWHHAAASYDGTTWRLYLDGKLETKLLVGNFTPRSDSIQHAALGTAMNSTGAAAGFLQGTLDEARVWGVARTGADIRSAKDAEITTSQPGLLARWSLDEGIGTSVGDTSGHNVTGTAVGGPTWVSPYGFPQDTSSPTAPSSLIATPDDGAVALAWTANADSDLAGYNIFRSTSPGPSTASQPINGGDLVRSTSYSDTGLTNGTTYYYVVVAVDSANNASSASNEDSAAPLASGSKGLQFNGSSQYVTFGAAPGLATPTFTIETWFMRTGAGAGQQTGTGGLTSAVPLLTKGRNEAEGSNVDMNYFLGIDTTSNALAVDFEEGASGSSPGLNHPLIGSTAVTNDVWHHAAATYDGTRWKLYLDGRLDASLLVGEPARGDSIQHAALGTAMNSSGAALGFFQGVLDEARVWDHARTGAEIRTDRSHESPSSTSGLLGQWHLDEVSGTNVADATGNGANGTTVGAPQHVSAYGFPQDTTPPASVQGLDATADSGSVALSWSANGDNDLAGYNVYRSTTSPVDTNTSPLNGDDLVASPNFSDPNVVNGTTYYYAVTAVDTSNNSSSPAEKSAQPVQGDPVLVGAGDIADCDRTEDSDTAALVSGISGGVFTIGDNVYDNGLASEFASCYEPSWGAFKSRTRPTPGNHDYGNGSNSGQGYFGYFNSFAGQAGDADKGYYSYDVGDYWHVVVLNSECYFFSVCSSSAQLQWLDADLDASAGRNVVALFHRPRWSSGNSRPGITVLQPLWQSLYDHGAELVLSGHDHHYERFAPQDANGNSDVTYGVRQLIVGTGGAALSGLGTTAANSLVRNNTTYGVLKLTLRQASYDWQFVPIAGQSFTDSGTASVHAAPPDTAAPTVSIVSAVPSSLGPSDTSTDVTWHASENGAYSVRVGGTDCTSGTAVASGSYSNSPTDVATTINAGSLADGQNTVRVCVVDQSTNAGSATTVVSKNSTPPANALRLDGSNDYVTFGQATSALGSTQFTLETWFRRTAPGVGTSTGSGGIASAIPLLTKGRAEQDTPANLNMNYFLGIDASSNALVADFEDDAGGENHPVSGVTAIAADGTWHHAAATYDGSTWRLYLDGRLDASMSTGGETPEDTSIQHAALGTALDSTGAASGFFAGDLDEARIWNVARTGAQIRSSKDAEIGGAQGGLRGRWGLNEGGGLSAGDSSGNGVTGTLTNGPAWVTGYAFPQDVTSPATPMGLTATAGDSQISLSWNANAEADVAGYNLYRSLGSPVSTAGTPLNGPDLITGTSFSDLNVTNGTPYHYVLVAVDGADNASGPSAEASTSPAQGDPVFVGAGDIADCTRTQDTATANLVSAIPGDVWTAGDNVYQNGLLSEFTNCYDPNWGAFKARTHPTPGNHDYGNGSNTGAGYFDYFNGVGNASGPAGDRDKGYYSYDIGSNWHIVVLSSECDIYAPCTMASQLAWLRSDLAANASRNVIGLFHRPRWTSGATRPGNTSTQGLWQTLYEYGAEFVLSGHDHDYERFAPQNGAGQADASFGVRQFVVGTGGAALGSFGTTAANSEVRNATTYGVMKFTLHPSSYDWQFVPIAGQSFTDSGTSAVHGVPNLRPVIDSVTIDQLAPRTNDTLTATVTSHDPNGDAVTYAYQWRRNGVDITGATASTLNLATTGNGNKGDQITLRVTGSDASGAGSPFTSSAVTVANTPPQATVSLNTHAPATNAILTATATKSDADGDTVALTFVWKTNGVVKKTTTTSASLTDTFDLSQAGNGDAGDTVSVEVTPNDGTINGTVVSDSASIDTAPATPSALTVVLTTTAVNLDWANNSESDLAGYNIYRASSSGGPFTKLNGSPLTTSQYTDTTAPAQATSYYRVTAIDTGGAESPPASIDAPRGIALRGTSTAQGSNASSLSLGKPTGVVSGDLLLAVVDVGSAATITPPSGWTQVRLDTNGTALRQGTYRRVAGSAEPASYAFSVSGKQSVSGALLAYAGVSSAQPIDTTSGITNSGTSITANAVTTTVSDAAVIGFFGTAINTSIAPPITMSERAEVSSGGKQKTTTEAADMLQPNASSTGAKSATASGSAANIGQLVALRPSTAAPSQDLEPPTKPAGLTASAVSASQINLSWTASNDNVGIDHYVITRGTSTFSTAQTQYSDTGLTANTSYTYTVTAYDAAGNASPVSDPASTTTLSGGGGGGGSGITFRSVATAQERSASAISISKPAGVQAGDLLLASVDVRTAPAAITAPAGWAPLQQTESGGVMTKATFWHVAGPSEPASYSWSVGSAQAITGLVLAYGGVDAANPIVDSTTAATTTTSLAAPSATAEAGSLVVALAGLSTNGGVTQPSSMTERAEATAGSGQTRVTGEASDAVQANPGPTGVRIATAAKAAPGVAQLVVLRRAA